jgi:hypothetical protein
MRTRITLALLLITAAPAVLADATTESRWRLGAAIGYGLRTNPLIQSDDIPIVVDLDIAWFGDHLFFDNGDLGLTIVDNKLVTTSLVARVNSDRVFFGKTDTKFINIDIAGEPLAQEFEFSVPDRDYAVELGIEALSDGDWGQLRNLPRLPLWLAQSALVLRTLDRCELQEQRPQRLLLGRPR